MCKCPSPYPITSVMLSRRRVREKKMPKGFNLRCAAGKTALWLQGKGAALRPGQAFVLLPIAEGETEDSPAGYRAPLRQALIDDNAGHVNLLVCEADYKALKRGIENLPPVSSSVKHPMSAALSRSWRIHPTFAAEPRTPALFLPRQ